MHTPFTDNYDKQFLLDTMMGPNAMRITEELTTFIPLTKGMRVLDLGCGMGISSILLAEKYGVTVYAADLWVSPTDNHLRFSSQGLSDKIIPLSVDVTKGLPFAQGYFDAVISIDAYHYFGCNEDMLPYLLQFVKKNGHIGIAVCGVQDTFPQDSIPEEMQQYWQPDMNFYPPSWWRALWSREPNLCLQHCRAMDCERQAWSEWLQSPNPYAQRDIPMMEAEGGKYFSLTQLIGQKA
ncbi:methyltransferase domain-containing protein [Desulfovibrio subterraneus]|uniref:SAM-dependent methyltransferase n=1 Tax=Desulfovibrio subterraneus TaxID=2718620 RepID=UPI0022B9291C|nr:methyltransferase domain-containing protein [Desulfovibrio subterraneus]WBF66156.1 methyltransferase domain-containing protein [Desulfovibrio subterraneus]